MGVKAERKQLEYGSIHGNWKFVRDDGNRAGHSLGIFECLMCSNVFTRSITAVVSGKSRACKPCSKQLRRKPMEKSTLSTKAKHGWCYLTEEEKKHLHLAYVKRYKSIEGRSDALYGAAKRSSRKKGISFTLTKDWIAVKLKQGVCEVTGIPFEFSDTSMTKRNKYSPSLDRKNSDAGYTPDNTRVVVWMYNLWKNVYTDKEVQDFAQRIVETAGKL